MCEECARLAVYMQMQTQTHGRTQMAGLPHLDGAVQRMIFEVDKF